MIPYRTRRASACYFFLSGAGASAFNSAKACFARGSSAAAALSNHSSAETNSCTLA